MTNFSIAITPMSEQYDDIEFEEDELDAAVPSASGEAWELYEH